MPVQTLPENIVAWPVLDDLITQLGAATADRLLAGFEEDFDGIIRDLRAADGDAEALLEHAHALAGGAGSLGFAALAQGCREIEKACAAARLEDAVAILGRMDDIIEQTRTALVAIRERLKHAD